MLINHNDLDKDDYSSKLKEIKEKIIEFVTHFKDLPKEEVIKTGSWTQHIIRSDNIIKFQPPYSMDEVISFEDRNNIKLPAELKTYLTEISRSILYKHPKVNSEKFYIIDLKNNDNLVKTCVLEHEIQVSPGLYTDDEDDEDEDDIHPLLNYHGMMYLRDVGCGYTDQIVLNGKFRGCVVNESFAGDGPIKIINNSFYQYICNTALINTEA